MGVKEPKYYKTKVCPNCNSGDVSIEYQGHIIYYYEKSKFAHKVFDHPDVVFECMDCGWRDN